MRHAKIKNYIVIFIGIITILVLIAFKLFTSPAIVAAAPVFQEESCLPILQETVSRAGIPGVIVEQYGDDDSWREDDVYCYIRLDEERGDVVYYTGLSMQAYPLDSNTCTLNEINYSFNGYEANLIKDVSFSGNLVMMDTYTHGYWDLTWRVESGGYCHEFIVSNNTRYPGWEDYEIVENPITGSLEPQGSGENVIMPDVDPVIYAETLWSIAESYMPFSDGNIFNDNFEGNDSPPFTGDSTYSEEDEQSSFNPDRDDVPGLVVVGSVGVPLVGALVGTLVSMRRPTSGTARRLPRKKPRYGSENDDGFVWSPRPWDEAGPGYVPKEEYRETMSHLSNGEEWTAQGWKTTNQIRQNEQWDINNDTAVREEDAAWREQHELERNKLEQKKAELEERKQELEKIDFDINRMDLEADLHGIKDGLEKENIYVINPYQGDPTIIFYRSNAIKNISWDNTIGRLTGDQGLTCEGFVQKTEGKVVEAVGNRFPGAKVENMLLQEKSTMRVVEDDLYSGNQSRKKKATLLDRLDAMVDDNHNLFKVTLPDGSEWAVDYHQYMAGNSPLMRPWSEVVKEWGADYMGEEFMQTSRHTIIAKPKIKK